MPLHIVPRDLRSFGGCHAIMAVALMIGNPATVAKAA
jgi:hypothetical protein